MYKLAYIYSVTLLTGNVSADEMDYYTLYSSPNYAIIPKYTKSFILNISVVQDYKFEENENIEIKAIPQKLPDNHTYSTTCVTIIDDDCKFADLATQNNVHLLLALTFIHFKNDLFCLNVQHQICVVITTRAY